MLEWSGVGRIREMGAGMAMGIFCEFFVNWVGECLLFLVVFVLDGKC
jgi:hypothetical protein